MTEERAEHQVDPLLEPLERSERAIEEAHTAARAALGDDDRADTIGGPVPGEGEDTSDHPTGSDTDTDRETRSDDREGDASEAHLTSG